MPLEEELKQKIQNVTDAHKVLSPVAVNGVVYRNSKRFSFERRLELFRQLSFLATGGCLLDECCNSGINSFILGSLYPKLKITGTDISEDAIDIAKLSQAMQPIDAIFYVQDVEVPQDYSKYDYILNCGISNDLTYLENHLNRYRRNGFSGQVLVVLNEFDGSMNMNLSYDEVVQRREDLMRKYKDSILVEREVPDSFDHRELIVLRKI